MATTTGYRRRQRAARKAEVRLERRRARRAAVEACGAGIAARLPDWTPGQWAGLAMIPLIVAELVFAYHVTPEAIRWPW